MATGKITKRSVDALKAGDTDQFLWDTDRKGFGFKHTPTGKGMFLIQYRLHGGRSAKAKRFTIGPLGIWTPEAAGKEAERLLRLVGQGIDPAKESRDRKHEAETLLIKDYAAKFYELEVMPNWEKSSDWAEGFLRLHIVPHVGSIALPDFDTRCLTDLLDKYDKRPAVKAGIYAVIRRMFRWAKSRGDIKYNPISDFEGPPLPKARQRWLNDEEIRTFWLATGEIDPPFREAYRLLLATGQRLREVSGGSWSEFNRADRLWIVPPARTKNKEEHLVPLSDLAVAILDDLAGGSAWPRKGLVFTTTGTTPISGWSKKKGELTAEMVKILTGDDEEAADLPHWVNHDLRRTMATCMQRLRIPNEHIEAVENRLAGRSRPGAAKHYLLWQFYEEKREALDRWGALLSAIISNDAEALEAYSAKTATVVPFAKRA